jgi:hypothetical protein
MSKSTEDFYINVSDTTAHSIQRNVSLASRRNNTLTLKLHTKTTV